MMLKRAQATLTKDNMVTPEVALKDAGASEQFRKCIATIKRVAPRSDEFLYFRARAITAMEAANLNVEGKVIGDGFIDDRGIWKSASGLEPYYNQNGDAFCETELLKGYKSFIGKGLYVNHSSDNAESIRGMVIDARWVLKGKYVEVLVAIDKIAHPDLARQIEAGYQRDVSMGTQVGYSICSICANKAITESDYCEHIRNWKGKRVQGQLAFENNYELNFIELSIVSIGADNEAKIREIVAGLKDIIDVREKKPIQCLSAEECNKIANTIDEVIIKLNSFKEVFSHKGGGVVDKEILEKRKTKRLSYLQGNEDVKDKNITNDPTQLGWPNETKYPRMNPPGMKDVRDVEQKAFEGAARVTEKEFIGPPDGGKGDLTLKQRLQRAKARRDIIREGDEVMIDQEKEARKARRAKMIEGYFQGNEDIKDKNVSNDPNQLGWPNETKYPRMNPVGMKDVRDVEQKAFEGAARESAKEFIGPPGGGKGDLQLKELLQRARLRTRFAEAQNKKASTFTVFAGITPVLSATAEEIFGDELLKPAEENSATTNYDWLATKEYGEEIIKAIRKDGFKKVAYWLKGAQALELPPMPGEEVAGASVSTGTVSEVLEKLESVLQEAQGLVGEIEALSGSETSEMGAAEGEPEMEGTVEDLTEAKEELAALQSVHNKAVKEGKKEVVAEVETAIQEAVTDAVQDIADAQKVIEQVRGMEDKEVILAQRKERRKLLAEKKYDVSIQPAGVKLIEEAHKEKNKEMARATGDGGVVENIIEQQQKDIAMVNKMPKGELRARLEKRRELMAEIEKDIAAEQIVEVKGAEKVVEADKTAEVDKAARDYWTKYFGKEGKEPEFARDLLKEYDKGKKKAELGDEKVRIRRAMELAHDMRKKSLLSEDTDAAESTKADQLLELDEAGFAVMADTVQSVKTIRKTAALGSQGTSDTSLGRAAESQPQGLVDELGSVGWTDRGRGWGVGA